MHGSTRHNALIPGCYDAHRCPRFLPACLLLLSIGLGAAPAIASAPGELRVKRLAPVVIEPDNNYSENTRLNIRIVYPEGHRHAGEPVPGKQRLTVEEWRTRIYDGQYGATRLPITLETRNGEAEVVLKSLARFNVYDSRNAPIPQVAVFYGRQRTLIDIPHWVDEDGNDKTDWLEARVEDILQRARNSGLPEVQSVVAALGGWKESYKRDCGGFTESDPRHAHIASVCIDWDGVNAHRLNTRQELSATVLHEIRHVWVHYQPEHSTYKQKLLSAPSGQREKSTCDHMHRSGEVCSVHIRDERYAAQEADAEAFANKYKALFP